MVEVETAQGSLKGTCSPASWELRGGARRGIGGGRRMRGRHSRPPWMEHKEGSGQQRRMLRAVKDLENGEGDI